MGVNYDLFPHSFALMASSGMDAKGLNKPRAGEYISLGTLRGLTRENIYLVFSFAFWFPPNLLEIVKFLEMGIWWIHNHQTWHRELTFRKVVLIVASPYQDWMLRKQLAAARWVGARFQMYKEEELALMLIEAQFPIFDCYCRALDEDGMNEIKNKVRGIFWTLTWHAWELRSKMLELERLLDYDAHSWYNGQCMSNDPRARRRPYD